MRVVVAADQEVAQVEVGVAACGGVDVEVDEERPGTRVLDREPELLNGLAPRRRGRRLPGVDVAAGLHPDAETLVEVQYGAARTDHDPRCGDVGGIGVLVARSGEPVQFGQKARLGARLSRRCRLMTLNECSQVRRGGAHAGTD